jgi:hypothetical protein
MRCTGAETAIFSRLMLGKGRLQRRGRDSNPRWTKPPIPVFETGAFNRSATSPVIRDGSETAATTGISLQTARTGTVEHAGRRERRVVQRGSAKTGISRPSVPSRSLGDPSSADLRNPLAADLDDGAEPPHRHAGGDGLADGCVALCVCMCASSGHAPWAPR